MSSFDLDKMRRLHETLYTSAVQTAFGDSGVEPLKHLISVVTQLHARTDPGLRKHPLAVLADVGLVPAALSGPVVHVNAINNLTIELDGPALVRANSNGSLDVCALDTSALSALSSTAIVYFLHAGNESFILAGKPHQVFNPMPGFPSVFCKPTFSSLQAALEDYRVRQASNSTCYILLTAWHDDKRLWFNAKPESTMRRSLTQYLRNVLRDANVKPEQNVDESHPVDIHVQFTSTSQHAIIEIKWLGQSINPSTGLEATGYTKRRALEGAQQLVDYIDKTIQSSPHYEARGYLVVFDGRRKGLKVGAKSLAPAQALGYQSEDVVYCPDYAALRKDFAPPVRIFLQPLLH
jgi:hypothetical protein